MLAKSKASGLILSFVFMACVAGAFLAVYYLRPVLAPLSTPLSAPSADSMVVLAAFLALVAVLVYRSGMVMGLEEAVGFGPRGLAGWVACGVIFGSLDSLFNTYLLPALSKSVLYGVALVAGNMVLLPFAYWAAFRRNIFKMIDAKSFNFLHRRSAEAIFFMVGGLLITVIGLFWAFNIAVYSGAGSSGAANSGLKGFWTAVGVTCMGLDGILLGARNIRRYRDGFTNRLLLVDFALFAIGLVCIAVGFAAAA